MHSKKNVVETLPLEIFSQFYARWVLGIVFIAAAVVRVSVASGVFLLLSFFSLAWGTAARSSRSLIIPILAVLNSAISLGLLAVHFYLGEEKLPSKLRLILGIDTDFSDPQYRLYISADVLPALLSAIQIVFLAITNITIGRIKEHRLRREERHRRAVERHKRRLKELEADQFESTPVAVQFQAFEAIKHEVDSSDSGTETSISSEYSSGELSDDEPAHVGEDYTSFSVAGFNEQEKLEKQTHGEPTDKVRLRYVYTLSRNRALLALCLAACAASFNPNLLSCIYLLFIVLVLLYFALPRRKERFLYISNIVGALGIGVNLFAVLHALIVYSYQFRARYYVEIMKEAPVDSDNARMFGLYHYQAIMSKKQWPVAVSYALIFLLFAVLSPTWRSLKRCTLKEKEKNDQMYIKDSVTEAVVRMLKRSERKSRKETFIQLYGRQLDLEHEREEFQRQVKIVTKQDKKSKIVVKGVDAVDSQQVKEAGEKEELRKKRYQKMRRRKMKNMLRKLGLLEEDQVQDGAWWMTDTILRFFYPHLWRVAIFVILFAALVDVGIPMLVIILGVLICCFLPQHTGASFSIYIFWLYAIVTVVHCVFQIDIPFINNLYESHEDLLEDLNMRRYGSDYTGLFFSCNLFLVIALMFFIRLRNAVRLQYKLNVSIEEQLVLHPEKAEQILEHAFRTSALYKSGYATLVDEDEEDEELAIPEGFDQSDSSDPEEQARLSRNKHANMHSLFITQSFRFTVRPTIVQGKVVKGSLNNSAGPAGSSTAGPGNGDQASMTKSQVSDSSAAEGATHVDEVADLPVVDIADKDETDSVAMRKRKSKERREKWGKRLEKLLVFARLVRMKLIAILIRFVLALIKYSYIVSLVAIYFVSTREANVANFIYIIFFVSFAASFELAKRWWSLLVIFSQIILVLRYMWQLNIMPENSTATSVIGLTKDTSSLAITMIFWEALAVVFVVVQKYILEKEAKDQYDKMPHTYALSGSKPAPEDTNESTEQRAMQRAEDEEEETAKHKKDTLGELARKVPLPILDHVLTLIGWWIRTRWIYVSILTFFLVGLLMPVSIVSILFLCMAFMTIAIIFATENYIVPARRSWVPFMFIQMVILVGEYIYQLSDVRKAIDKAFNSRGISKSISLYEIGFVSLTPSQCFVGIMPYIAIFVVSAIQSRLFDTPEEEKVLPEGTLPRPLVGIVDFCRRVVFEYIPFATYVYVTYSLVTNINMVHLVIVLLMLFGRFSSGGLDAVSGPLLWICQIFILASMVLNMPCFDRIMIDNVTIMKWAGFPREYVPNIHSIKPHFECVKMLQEYIISELLFIVQRLSLRWGTETVLDRALWTILEPRNLPLFSFLDDYELWSQAKRNKHPWKSLLYTLCGLPGMLIDQAMVFCLVLGCYFRSNTILGFVYLGAIVIYCNVLPATWHAFRPWLIFVINALVIFELFSLLGLPVFVTGGAETDSDIYFWPWKNWNYELQQWLLLYTPFANVLMVDVICVYFLSAQMFLHSTHKSVYSLIKAESDDPRWVRSPRSFTNQTRYIFLRVLVPLLIIILFFVVSALSTLASIVFLVGIIYLIVKGDFLLTNQKPWNVLLFLSYIFTAVQLFYQIFASALYQSSESTQTHVDRLLKAAGFIGLGYTYTTQTSPASEAAFIVAVMGVLTMEVYFFRNLEQDFYTITCYSAECAQDSEEHAKDELKIKNDRMIKSLEESYEEKLRSKERLGKLRDSRKIRNELFPELVAEIQDDSASSHGGSIISMKEERERLQKEAAEAKKRGDAPKLPLKFQIKRIMKRVEHFFLVNIDKLIFAMFGEAGTSDRSPYARDLEKLRQEEIRYQRKKEKEEKKLMEDAAAAMNGDREELAPEYVNRDGNLKKINLKLHRCCTDCELFFNTVIQRGAKDFDQDIYGEASSISIEQIFSTKVRLDTILNLSLATITKYFVNPESLDVIQRSQIEEVLKSVLEEIERGGAACNHISVRQKVHEYADLTLGQLASIITDAEKYRARIRGGRVVPVVEDDYFRILAEKSRERALAIKDKDASRLNDIDTEVQQMSKARRRKNSRDQEKRLDKVLAWVRKNGTDYKEFEQAGIPVVDYLRSQAQAQALKKTRPGAQTMTQTMTQSHVEETEFDWDIAVDMQVKYSLNHGYAVARDDSLQRRVLENLRLSDLFMYLEFEEKEHKKKKEEEHKKRRDALAREHSIARKLKAFGRRNITPVSGVATSDSGAGDSSASSLPDISPSDEELISDSALDSDVNEISDFYDDIPTDEEGEGDHHKRRLLRRNKSTKGYAPLPRFQHYVKGDDEVYVAKIDGSESSDDEMDGTQLNDVRTQDGGSFSVAATGTASVIGSTIGGQSTIGAGAPPKNKGKRRHRAALFILAAKERLFASSEFIVLLVFVINHLINGTLTSLIYILLGFGYITFANRPNPSRKFWNALLVFTAVILLLRAVVALPGVCMCHTKSTHIWSFSQSLILSHDSVQCPEASCTLDSGDRASYVSLPYILGIVPTKQYFALVALSEILVFFAILLQQKSMQRKAVWSADMERVRMTERARFRKRRAVLEERMSRAAPKEYVAIVDFHEGRNEHFLSFNKGDHIHILSRGRSQGLTSIGELKGVVGIFDIDMTEPFFADLPNDIDDEDDYNQGMEDEDYTSFNQVDVETGLASTSRKSRNSRAYDVEEEDLRDHYMEDAEGNALTSRQRSSRRKHLLSDEDGKPKKKRGHLRQFFHDLLHDTQRESGNYYPAIFVIQLVCFVYLLFFAPLFTGSSGSLITYISQSYLPGGFVIILLIQFLEIIVDRIIYLRRSILSKIIFQYITLLGYNAVMLWYFPLQIQLDVDYEHWHSTFSLTSSLQFFFVLKCCYWFVSAMQVRAGYFGVGSTRFFMRNYSTGSNILHQVYRLVPFMYEMRTILDWTFVPTTIDFFDYLRLEDIYSEVFTVACRVYNEEPKDKGAPRKFKDKLLLGCGILVLICLVIWLPLIILSMSLPGIGLQIVHVDEASLSIRFRGYSPFYSSTITDSESIETPFTPSDFASFRRGRTFISGDSHSVQIISFPTFSHEIWSVPVPVKSELVEQLRYNASDLYLETYVALHRPSGSNAKVNMTFSRKLSDQERLSFLDVLLHGNGTEMHIDNIASRFLHLPGTTGSLKDACNDADILDNNVAECVPISFLLSYDGCLDGTCNSALYTEDGDPKNRTIEFWHAEQEPENTDVEFSCPVFSKSRTIQFALVHTPVSTSSSLFNVIIAYGIVGIYVVLVVGVARLVRNVMSGHAHELMFVILPEPAPILRLCKDVILARNDGDLLLEEQLANKLLQMYRSPEAIMQNSAPQVNDDGAGAGYHMAEDNPNDVQSEHE